MLRLLPSAVHDMIPPSRPLAEAASEGQKLRLARSPQGLVAHDHSRLFAEKLAAHFPGTREWALVEICAWLDTLSVPQLFWLMGSGGTGKSVLSAALHDRVFTRVVAWHYCRHDDPRASAPSVLLKRCAFAARARTPSPPTAARPPREPECSLLLHSAQPRGDAPPPTAGLRGGARRGAH